MPTSIVFCSQGRKAAYTSKPTVAIMNIHTNAWSFTESRSARVLAPVGLRARNIEKRTETGRRHIIRLRLFADRKL